IWRIVRSLIEYLNFHILYWQPNDVADKRRPNTRLPLKKQLPMIIKILFNRTNLHKQLYT
ncbi:MAG: hypothetical protein Q8Q47_01490, partial [Ignavibacteriaceae bacterium]|nr:hypothetical protein [Ignavibacteriaceae bacterium]